MMAKENLKPVQSGLKGINTQKGSGGLAEMGNFSKSPQESSRQAKGVALYRPEVIRVHTCKFIPLI